MKNVYSIERRNLTLIISHFVILVIQFSQNHRVAEAGRDPQRSSGSSTLLKQGHLEPVRQELVQVYFDCLQGCKLHSLPGHPCKKVFSDDHKESSLFWFVLIASDTLTGSH